MMILFNVQIVEMFGTVTLNVLVTYMIYAIAKKNGFRTMQEMGHDLLLSGDLCYSEFERVLQSN